MSENTNPWITVLAAVIDGITGAASADQAEGIKVDADTRGQLILRARAQRDMTRRELADLSDVSEIKIGWYEDEGDRKHPFWKPSFDELIAFKRALGIHPDSIRKFL